MRNILARVCLFVIRFIYIIRGNKKIKISSWLRCFVTKKIRRRNILFTEFSVGLGLSVIMKVIDVVKITHNYTTTLCVLCVVISNEALEARNFEYNGKAVAGASFNQRQQLTWDAAIDTDIMWDLLRLGYYLLNLNWLKGRPVMRSPAKPDMPRYVRYCLYWRLQHAKTLTVSESTRRYSNINRGSNTYFLSNGKHLNLFSSIF